MVGTAQALIGVVATCIALVAAGAHAQGSEAFVVDGSCRDGQPHGAYELRDAAGNVRVVGAFNRGKRMGSFLFWSGGGARIAQLPYDDDVLVGNVATWYPPARGREQAQKLEAAVCARPAVRREALVAPERPRPHAAALRRREARRGACVRRLRQAAARRRGARARGARPGSRRALHRIARGPGAGAPAPLRACGRPAGEGLGTAHALDPGIRTMAAHGGARFDALWQLG